MTYISQFFSGAVDPALPHLVLILITVAGGAGVGAGIVWESIRAGHLWTWPTWLVIVGVVIEAAGTIVLFEFDEGISHAQQSKIISLDTRLAARNLSDEQILEIGDALRPFAGQKYIGSVAAGVSDGCLLWSRIDEALVRARWIRIEPSVTFGLGCHPKTESPIFPSIGLSVLSETTRSKDVGRAAARLGDLLGKSGLVTTTEAVPYNISGTTQNSPDVIVVAVGVKP